MKSCTTNNQSNYSICDSYDLNSYRCASNIYILNQFLIIHLKLKTTTYYTVLLLLLLQYYCCYFQISLIGPMSTVLNECTLHMSAPSGYRKEDLASCQHEAPRGRRELHHGWDVHCLLFVQLHPHIRRWIDDVYGVLP